MRHPLRRALAALPTTLAGLAVALGLVVAVPGTAHAEDFTFASAVAALPGATESRSGYSRDLFRHWVDADGDGCDTRAEILLAEAETRHAVGSGCALSGGRWFSYYDGVSQTSAGALDIDHVVPLAEAWDSGAGSWSSATREAYANDLGDSRSLVGVTAALNRSKGDQDVAEWLPPQQVCRYLREWVAVKLRWRLSVDSTERSALSGSGCTGTISVTRAR